MKLKRPASSFVLDDPTPSPHRSSPRMNRRFPDAVALHRKTSSPPALLPGPRPRGHPQGVYSSFLFDARRGPRRRGAAPGRRPRPPAPVVTAFFMSPADLITFLDPKNLQKAAPKDLNAIENMVTQNGKRFVYKTGPNMGKVAWNMVPPRIRYGAQNIAARTKNLMMQADEETGIRKKISPQGLMPIFMMGAVAAGGPMAMMGGQMIGAEFGVDVQDSVNRYWFFFRRCLLTSTPTRR